MRKKVSEPTQDKPKTTTTKKGGSKLGRSEILQVRLDPKMRYKIEIAGKIRKRTLSSVFEDLAEDLDFQVQIKGLPGHDGVSETAGKAKKITISLKSLIERVWHKDSVTRFIRLAQIAPQLLSDDELVIWQFIESQPYFWIDSPYIGGRRLVSKLVREIWDKLKNFTTEEDFDFQIIKESIFKLASEKDMSKKINNKEQKLDELQKLLNEIWP